MVGNNDSSHLIHIKKLEGAHHFAVWQKQCYNIQLKKKQAKPIKVKREIPFGQQNRPVVQQQIHAVNVPANAGNNQPAIAYNDEPNTWEHSGQPTANAELQAEMRGQQAQKDNLQAQQPANNDHWARRSIIATR
ncbi:hypothetical protein KP509_32G047800 [Ceratopteris richardii]|uniref:Uncharacterized protein n=1 Tax=Ceratopteris richardii TaxID=49495 RepID=A0A8T2QUL2_CERRI|nr:hypothetical protein KP509_32G047800 [Ceratopteris richardii]